MKKKKNLIQNNGQETEKCCLVTTPDFKEKIIQFISKATEVSQTE